MYAVPHRPFSSYHFPPADGFGWLSILFLNAAQRVPSESAAQGDFGLLAQRDSCGGVHSIPEGLSWKGTSGDCLVQPFISDQDHSVHGAMSPQILFVSKDEDSTASLGKLCQCSFTSKIIESILMQLLNLSTSDKSNHLTYASITLSTSSILKKRKSEPVLAEKQQN